MTNLAPFVLLLALSSAETALPHPLGLLPLDVLIGSKLIPSQLLFFLAEEVKLKLKSIC